MVLPLWRGGSTTRVRALACGVFVGVGSVWMLLRLIEHGYAFGRWLASGTP